MCLVVHTSSGDPTGRGMWPGLAPAATAVGSTCSSPSPHYQTALKKSKAKLNQALEFTTAPMIDPLDRLFNWWSNCAIQPVMSTALWLTDAACEVGIELISEERLRQLSEVQLEGPSDGVDVHLTHHHWHVFVICRRRRQHKDVRTHLGTSNCNCLYYSQ